MKKIKESGFTLIELLGTIVIIGILGTIAVTSVVNIKKSSNIRFDNSQVELMKQAGQTYFTDNKRLLPIVEGQINYVTLDKLIEKGYINKLYNSKKEEFDPTTSYAWVQKQNDGSYKYDCYCEIKGEKLAGTTAIPESKENNSIVTFEYENFYNNKSENKYYTNGKNNSIVKVHLNRNEVSEYRYEIYKKDTKDENSQYKISQREKLTTNLVNIKLNAKDYSDGEYFIKVTTYNSTGNSKQSSSSAKIYVDKTPPTCNITTTYQKDSNSAQKLWYSSKSKNNNNQELGVNSKLPISVDGSDRGSGIKFGSKHIFSDSEYTKQINNETGTYEAENTGKNGKEYYATVEDNVGNKATCSQIYYVDTELPTCKVNPVSKNEPVNGWYNISSTDSAELGILLSKLDNVDISDYGLTTSSTVTYNKKGEGTQNDTTNKGVNWYGYVKDYAGNTNSCSANFKVDIHAPAIKSFTLTNSQDNYNDIQPNIKINIDDKNNITYGFYSNHTKLARNYTEKGKKTYNFSALNPNRIDDFNGSTSAGYNGATYNINASALDEAGNETIATSNDYTVYTQCSEYNTTQGSYGTCSDTCGEGIQYAPEVYTDSHLGVSCGKTDNAYAQSCKMDDCPDDEYDNECDSDEGCDTSDKLICPKIKSKTKAEKWTNVNKVYFTLDFTNSNASSYDYYTKNLSNANSKYGIQFKDQPVTETTRGLEKEGKRKAKIVIKDSSGNTKNCYTKVYYIDRTPPTVSSPTETSKCNNLVTTNYFNVTIEDKLAGLKTGAFKWSTTNKINAGNSIKRSGKSHVECIATSASGNMLGLSYKVCDQAGNCETSKNWK